MAFVLLPCDSFGGAYISGKPRGGMRGCVTARECSYLLVKHVQIRNRKKRGRHDNTVLYQTTAKERMFKREKGCGVKSKLPAVIMNKSRFKTFPRNFILVSCDHKFPLQVCKISTEATKTTIR